MIGTLVTRVRSSRIAQGVGAGAVAIAIFAVGLLIGNGTIQLQLFSGVQSVNGSLPSELDYRTVNQVYQALKTNYDGKLTESQLLDGLKEGLAQATKDPYTEYFNPTQAKQFQNQVTNTFSGVGASLDVDSDGNIIVVAPIAGSPAEQAGLKPRDIIVAVDGASTTGMSPDVVAAKIRGKAGTTVTLKVVRDKTDQLTFTIKRADIQVPSVTTKTLDGNIGYIQITSFSTDTASLVAKAAQQFTAANVKGIVLDLRNNPGGFLDAAVDVSSLWITPSKEVLTVKGTSGEQTYWATGNDLLHGVPTVVLLNENSASASEITAGALHDNSAAYLIGVKSFGKGIVQDQLNFPDGSELKVTTAYWYRPNGQNINKKGITPDQNVADPTDDQTKAGVDPQLTAAEAYLSR